MLKFQNINRVYYYFNLVVPANNNINIFFFVEFFILHSTFVAIGPHKNMIVLKPNKNQKID